MMWSVFQRINWAVLFEETVTEQTYQQDGAPPHFHVNVRNFLDRTEFPLRSPELTPLDFYFWGTLKNTA